MSRRFLVGITGASGAPYAIALLKLLRAKGVRVDLIVSTTGQKVLSLETGLGLPDLAQMVDQIFGEDDFMAPPASGSAPYDAMVIIPCTMGTLSAIAQGSARNLMHRAADAVLKEKKPLILVVRETPLNLIHLRNMVRVAEAGAVIFPAMPAFYHNPLSLDHLIEYFVQRLVSFMGIEVPEMKRWGE